MTASLLILISRSFWARIRAPFCPRTDHLYGNLPLVRKTIGEILRRVPVYLNIIAFRKWVSELGQPINGLCWDR